MNAAAYCRSSKDRAEVSLLHQRRELETLADAKGLKIVEWFEDAVQSGSTGDRPAFLQLATAMKNQSRGWTTLLVYDTSRIARGRYIAQAFRHECKRRGVELIIARVPETDPVSTVILEAVMEAMDEVHSIMSREKGIAGMRENVRQGWRAGGRAPWGYLLTHTPTGAIRDGKPVMKSKLEPNADADLVSAYLKARARGVPRIKAMRDLAIDKPAATLIDIEWNAMLYAGHTVWNRHAEKKARGDGRPRRRDRSQWMMQRDTHPALITEVEAETILAKLTASPIGRSVSAAKASQGESLLAGMLVTSDGRQWISDGQHYRLKPLDGLPGKYIKRQEVERALLVQVRQYLKDPQTIEQLTAAMVKDVSNEDQAAPIRAEIEKLQRRRQRAAALALEDDGEVYATLTGELGRQIEALKREAEAVSAETVAAETLRAITPTQVREYLLGMDNDRAMIVGMVGKVVLDPDLTGRIEYRLCVASPRRSDRWATPMAVEPLRLVG